MRTRVLLALVLPLLLITSNALAIPMGSLVISVRSEKSSIGVEERPIIEGTVTDQASKPVSNVLVNISTAAGTGGTKTDVGGKFRYEFSNSFQPGQYIVNVKAQKDGYGVGLKSTTFFVKGIPSTQTQNQLQLKTVSGDKIKNDPIASKILKNIEITQKRQAEQGKKLKQIEENKKFLDQQRALADKELQNDLGSWFTSLDPFAPRNAYASFVSQINQTFQGLFWEQFNFTEQKTNDGLAAMFQVLNNGGSEQEARKAFIQNASTSRNELLKVNNDLNVKYGFADKKTQEQFNLAGKLPRHGR
ncbi:MAG: carboxypeptidase-like regulatory domain-containing protein [Nitrososphaerota archaeon]